MQTPPLFDGHNDLLSRLAAEKCSLTDIQNGYDSGHIDLPRARQGGFGGGFFAIFTEGCAEKITDALTAMQRPPYHLPMPPKLAQAEALPLAIRQLAEFQRLARAGLVTPCTDVQTLEAAIGNPETLAAVLHMEGVEAIDRDFHALEVFYQAGLRSLSLTWSRNNEFASGAPFAFPSSPDHGAGLTAAGIALVKMCNQIGIMLDVSHLNEKGFDDLARYSSKPIVATHSNAHFLTPHARNLTNRQLDIILESDGLVGVNFATAMLREDGKMSAETGFDPLLRHLDYLLEYLGEDRVAFGSDFDGATIPHVIKDCGGIADLRAVLRQSGYNDMLLVKLFYQNWVRILRGIL